MLDVPNSAPQRVLSFRRANPGNKVFAVFNFSRDPVRVTFKDALHEGSYRQEFATGKPARLDRGATPGLASLGLPGLRAMMAGAPRRE